MESKSDPVVPFLRRSDSNEPVFRRIDEIENLAFQIGAGGDLVAGLIPRGSIVLEVGESGIGKTPFNYQLAIAVASGRPFLGRKTQRGRVVIVDTETGFGQIATLCYDIRSHVGASDDELRRMLRIYSLNAPGSGRQPEIRDIASEQPDLVIVDSLAVYNPQLEEKNSSVLVFFTELRNLTRNGCTVVVVHHLRKPANNPSFKLPPLESEQTNVHDWISQARGAGALITGSDVRLAIARITGKDVNDSGAELVVRGFARLSGPIPSIHLRKVILEEGETLGGYEEVAPFGFLPPEERAAFEKLPDSFRYIAGQRIVDMTAGTWDRYITKLQKMGLLKKDAGKRSPFRKLAPVILKNDGVTEVCEEVSMSLDTFSSEEDGGWPE